jgi:hypothetical protein
MPRQPDPMSGAQVSARAKRMRGAWTEQVLLNLAGALVQATRWRAWEASGGEPGPQDNPGSWPRLPETPGERVELGITRLDMATPEGWEAARELLERALQENTRTREQLQAEIAADLAETLEHSPLLSDAFYTRHSERAGEMLLQRTLPVTMLSGAYQSLWRKPEHPLGLPPADHPISTALAGHEEAAALEQVAWEAARELYRALGDPRPDEHGRRGLERPEELRRWGERLGLVQPDDAVAVTDGLSDEEVHRAGTGLPWSKAQATMLSPRMQEHEGRPPGQLHRSERKPVTPAGAGYEALVSVAEYSSALEADPLAWAHVQKAQQLLETHGVGMARLSMLLSMVVCGRPDPLTPFLVTGEALLRSLSMDGKTSGGRGRVAAIERSTRLQELVSLARALDCVAVQTKDYIGKDAEGRRMFRHYSGRLWNVEIVAITRETQPGLEGLTDCAEELITDVQLMVRPGGWLAKFPVTGPKGTALWYGNVAAGVLKLSHQQNPLATALGLYLATALVEGRSRSEDGLLDLQVGKVLERVVPFRELERARECRETARNLRNKWITALELVQKGAGFTVQFCPNTYPAWAIPESLLGEREPYGKPAAPHGALDQLMKGHVLVGWPLPVLEANKRSKAAAQSEALAARVRNPKPLPKALAPAPASSNKPNGTLLKEARLATGLNQRDTAELLGLGKSTYNRMETCQRPLPRADLNRYLGKLAEHAQQERWERARRGGS